MDAGNWLTVVSILGGVLSSILLYVINQKNEKIKLLETKNDVLETTNRKQELQIVKLEITGVAAVQLFQQLPKATGQRIEESG